MLPVYMNIFLLVMKSWPKCNVVLPYSLVRPRNCHVLLPPASCNICYIEAQYKRERNQVDESVTVNDNLLKQPTIQNATISKTLNCT